jgi:hypothetical protein
LEIVYKGEVPYPALPVLPENPVFKMERSFRNFLLAKRECQLRGKEILCLSFNRKMFVGVVINAERAAVSGPSFASKILRTRIMHLEMLVDRFARFKLDIILTEGKTHLKLF